MKLIEKNIIVKFSLDDFSKPIKFLGSKIKFISRNHWVAEAHSGEAHPSQTSTMELFIKKFSRKNDRVNNHQRFLIN